MRAEIGAGRMTLAQRTSPPSNDSPRGQADRIQAIFDFTQSLSSATTLESVAEAAIEGICKALRVDRASVLLFNEDGSIRHKAWRGLSPEDRAAMEADSLWKEKACDNQPLLIGDVHREPALACLVPALDHAGIASLAFVPLCSGGRMVGKLGLYYGRRHVPAKDEVLVAKTIAAHVAFAVDRRGAEVRLAESEARYRDIIQTANEGVLVLDEDARITLVNQRFAAMVGFDAAELLGKQLFDILDEEGAELARANLKRRRQGVREQFDFRFQHRDGRPVWGIVNAAPVLDADGTYRGSLTLITDIRERKEAEQRYRALAESIPQMAIMTAIDGTITFCNEAWTDYTGLDLQQTVEVSPRNLLPPEDRPTMLRQLEKARASDTSQTEQVRVRRSDGQYRWHVCTANPLRMADGTIDGWISTFTDIHDAKRGEERERFLAGAVAALADSLDFEATLRSLADLIVPELAQICAIDVLEPEGVLRHIEIRCEDPEDLAAVSDLRLRNWLIAPGLKETVRERLLAGEGVMVPAVDDGWIDLAADSEAQAELGKGLGVRSFMVVPLKTRNTVLGGMSLAVTDQRRTFDSSDMNLALELAHRAAVAIDNARLYQQSRALADRLSRANQAKDEFLGLVSHEMRTPITTIYGNAQVLQRIWQIIDDKDRRSALADIEHDAERLQRIIENMLVLARIDAGQEVATEPVLLNRVVSAVVEDMRNRYLGRTIDVRVPKAMLPVVAQPTYLELVLRNLISNAHKYSPEEAPIAVTLAESGDEAVVCVEDRGPGIGDEEAERIFQPFFRSSRTATSAPGAGLGLAVCRRLIEAQGGSISAANRPGGGLAVCFRLRLEPSHSSTSP